MLNKESLCQLDFDSPLERRTYKAFKKFGLAPITQHKIGVFRVDFAFPDLMVAQEVDGKEYHKDKARQKFRDGIITGKGWTIRRYPGWLCHRHPNVLPAEIVLRFLKNPTHEQVELANTAMVMFAASTSPDFQEPEWEDA